MKASILTGACVARDAVSESVRGSIRALRDLIGADVKLFAGEVTSLEFNTRVTSSPSEVMIDAHFMRSDIILYHFGFYYPMFDLLSIGNGFAKQIVRFHNVTPRSFMPESTHRLLERSFEQISLIDCADAVLADSSFNSRGLLEAGISPDLIEVSPLYVKFPNIKMREPLKRQGRSVRVLFVGRLVESKGVFHLIESFAALVSRGNLQLRLTLAGNLYYSDKEYVQRIRDRISHDDIAGLVTIAGSPDDQELLSLYREADIFVMPSLHEGFCVPILEAFHSDTVPVTSDAGNLPALVGKLGEVYPAGDVSALTACLGSLVEQFSQGAPDRLRVAGNVYAWNDYRIQVSELLAKYTYEAYAAGLAETVARLTSAAAPSQDARARSVLGEGVKATGSPN